MASDFGDYHHFDAYAQRAVESARLYPARVTVVVDGVTYQLSPREARALASRLVELADYADEVVPANT